MTRILGNLSNRARTYSRHHGRSQNVPIHHCGATPVRFGDAGRKPLCTPQSASWSVWQTDGAHLRPATILSKFAIARSTAWNAYSTISLL